MSTFNDIFAEQYFLKGELLTLKQGDKGDKGDKGDDGKIITVDDETKVIHGEDGKDGEVKFLVVHVVDGMFTITLPDPATVVESGIYYYKDQQNETNTTFFYNDVQLGKFYFNRKQNITSLKADGRWTN